MKRALLLVYVAACALLGLGLACMAQAAPTWQSSSGSSLAGGATPTPCVAGYTCGVTPGATIVPGTVDAGNHCDDCITNVTLPFPVSLYSTSYASVNVSSNGNAQFVSTNPEFANVCLPVSAMGPTIFAYWDDLVTDGTKCTGGCGIYTSVSGSAPNRIFNIEWRTFYFSNPGNAYFEIRLYEATSNFDIIIGTINTGGTATIGVQDGAGRFTQCVCGTTATANSRIVFTATSGSCPTPTPSATPSTGGTILGHLTWQGVASTNRPLVSGTLTLCVSGIPANYNFNTDANGNFVVTTGLSDGVYHWQVRGGRHISSASPDSGGDLIISGGQGSQEFGTQKGGNTNPQTDDIVNATDFNLLKIRFGQSGGFSSDFNYDEAVNSSDFNILKTNFGQSGIGLTCP